MKYQQIDTLNNSRHDNHATANETKFVAIPRTDTAHI